jgi:hypothetical protein
MSGSSERRAHAVHGWCDCQGEARSGCQVRHARALLPPPSQHSFGHRPSHMHSSRYEPDGGVKHSYVPVVLRCGYCGANGGTKACVGCHKVHYCNQVQTPRYALTCSIQTHSHALGCTHAHYINVPMHTNTHRLDLPEARLEASAQESLQAFAISP